MLMSSIMGKTVSFLFPGGQLKAPSRGALQAGGPGLWPALIIASVAAACSPPDDDRPPALPPVDNREVREEQAAEAIHALDREIDSLNRRFGPAFWVAATFPSPDAKTVSASSEELIRQRHMSGLAHIARAFGDAAHSGSAARKLMHLGHRTPLPLPGAAEARAALTAQAKSLEKAYSEIEICMNGVCFGAKEAEQRLHESTSATGRAAIWHAWREATATLKPKFDELIPALNAAARAWGYRDMAHWWVARYERPKEAWAEELNALHQELAPFASALRCHVKAELGSETAQGSLIPAAALGSLSGRNWSHLHERVRAGLPPYEPLALDVREKFEDVEEMMRWAESTYRSAGFPPLPDQFWERSQFVRPDREISACPRFGTNVDWYRDVRLTMCGKRTRQDLLWGHRMLAFLYYDLAFAGQDWVFRDPPHLGFHFANSGAMTLALTPEFLKREGLLEKLPPEEERLSAMLHDALKVIPGIGYGLAVDQWRWAAFGDETDSESLEDLWWTLRAVHQGVIRPRTDGPGFEPVAHNAVVSNRELLPGALGDVLQFQFYAEACKSAGHQGPLHTCSFYGSEAVAKRLWPVLEMGAAKPWHEVLEAYTGSTRMNAQPLLDYFAPLRAWLAEKNESRSCG